MYRQFVRAFAITPSDTVPQPPMHAIYVGGTGTINVVMAMDTTAVNFTAVPVGTVLDIQPKYVRTTSTATLMIGLMRG